MKDLSNLPEREHYNEKLFYPSEIVLVQDYFFIYSVTNLRNGKRYIGKTINPKKRAIQHFSQINRRTHSNITDFEDDYDFEILADKIRFENSVDSEIFYMKKYKTYNPGFGYNTKDTHFYQKRKPTRHLIEG